MEWKCLVAVLTTSLMENLPDPVSRNPLGEGKIAFFSANHHRTLMNDSPHSCDSWFLQPNLQSPISPNPVWMEQISIKCQRKEKRIARSQLRKLCKCLGDGYGRCPPHASVHVLCLGMVMVALSSSLCLWAVIGFLFLTQGFRVSFLSPCLVPSVTTV